MPVQLFLKLVVLTVASGVPKNGLPSMVPGSSRSTLTVSFAGTVVSTVALVPVPSGSSRTLEMHCWEQPTFDCTPPGPAGSEVWTARVR